MTIAICLLFPLKVNLLLGEPFFNTSSLPWHNIHFLYARTELRHLLSEKCTILPTSAAVKAVAVEFKDLWKIRADVSKCEGFDLSAFDKVIEVGINVLIRLIIADR